ncbi:DUF4175 family protein [Hymenobacter psychrotolerans]|uniref:DUF4175 domain-containing protein n=1 Tax=Hymenobacter psychrotolerans DSM 18569 TaxID=1121959 RepID=A0A1M6PK98_9BACT|nr:DUF4175 family protein [Hymenobacter psychrotolerans]SHK08338.1 protein of unknown function [Hymenobacter psychrotolerans DSM 18569]
MSPITTTTQSGPEQLRHLARREARRRTLALLLLAGAVGLAAVAWARHWPAAWPAVGAGLGVLLLAVGYGIYRLQQPRLPALARRLDRLYPELEDSTGLLLHHTDAPALNLLEQLQRQRVQARLTELQEARPHLLPFSWRPVAVAGTLLVLLAAGSGLYRPSTPPSAALAVRFPDAPAAAPGQAAPPRLLETRVLVTPPAYTRRPAFAPASLSFSCPVGSRVRWTVRVSGAEAGAPVLELGRQRLPFRTVAGQPLEFVVETQVAASGLYRLRFAGQTSDDYALEALPDQAPTLQIQTPKPYTLIEFGQRPQVAVRVAAHDDYGLLDAQLVATVAQGQGEAVKFREVVTDLSGSLSGQPRQATLAALLRLPALGLTYGDEVYFYVRARDNARHLSRSDTYLVQWEDTTVQDGLTDLSLGVNVVPAYFRSQRQIIIDTEKLMAERATLPAATFADRANSLGHDQKILRLRYGKFLSEEFEGSIGETAGPPAAQKDSADDHADHDDHAHENPADHAGHDHGTAGQATGEDANSPQALMDPYLHKHDDSETADFLEPAVKAKLRGVLNQMWEAELRLRLAKPAEARPFEYRALRLLKQVQQQTRAYVRKSGYEPPVLPEATLRLSGDLAGAAAPRLSKQVPAPATQPEIRAAIQRLAALQTGQAATAADALLLERAGQAVAQAALQRPGAYLPAVRALRQLTTDIRAGRAACSTCFAPAEKALTSLLPAPAAAPLRSPRPDRLGQRYLQAL